MPPKFNLLGDLGTSITRTVVPLIVGIVVSYAIRHGIHLDQAEVTGWLTPLCSGAYYAGARKLETVVPSLGWLLGVPKPPTY